ncbi:MAG: polysaccharide biosynthesis protein [Clostridium sp.]
MREESSAMRGMLVLSMAGILAKVISVIYVPILKDIIGIGGFGIYQQSAEVFVFVYAITSLGSQPAVAKVVTELTALDNPRDSIRALKVARRFYAGIGTICAILLVLCAFPIGELKGNTNIAYGIIALAPCVILTSILSAYRGFFQGRNNMTAIAISQIAEQILNVVLSLTFAYILVQISTPLGAAGGQIGTSVGALVAILYLIYAYDKKKYEEEALTVPYSKRRASDKKILHKLIKYSVPIVLSAGLQNFGGVVDMINVNQRLQFAGFTLDQADELYGLLGLYKTMYGVPLIIVTAIGTTVLPAIARATVLRDRKEVRRKINYAFRLTFTVTIPAAVGLSILSREIYNGVFGSDNGYTLLMYGSFIIVLMGMTQIQSVVLQSINKLYFILGSFMIGIVVKIITNYTLVGIAAINIYGVLVGNLLWHLIPAILNHNRICKLLRVKISIVKHVVKPIIASAGMAIVIFLLKMPLPFIVRFIGDSPGVARIFWLVAVVIFVAIGGIVYVLLMIEMGGIRKRDIESISGKAYRMLPQTIRRRLH